MKPVICPYCKCQCWDSDYLYYHIGDKHRHLVDKEETNNKEETNDKEETNETEDTDRLVSVKVKPGLISVIKSWFW